MSSDYYAHLDGRTSEARALKAEFGSDWRTAAAEAGSYSSSYSSSSPSYSSSSYSGSSYSSGPSHNSYSNSYSNSSSYYDSMDGRTKEARALKAEYGSDWRTEAAKSKLLS